MAREWQVEPIVGQKFWQEGTGSGIIEGVDYREKIVYVDFYEKGRRTYEFDEIFGCWTDRFQGTWQIFNI